MTLQPRYQFSPIDKGGDQFQNERPRRVLWQLEHDDSSVSLGRIVPYVGETEVPGQKAEALRLRVDRDGLVRGVGARASRTSSASWPFSRSRCKVRRGRSASTRKRTGGIAQTGRG